MEKISFDQFVAEIETSLSNYADSNDIDRQSIKTWLIQALRKFGKNICEKNETVVEVKNKRALLPEYFKSLTIALKVDTAPIEEREQKQLVYERQYIENPAVFDILTLQYIQNFCETKTTTEKIFANKESHKVYDIQLLELEDYISKDVLDVDCVNLHPSVRNPNNNRISIVNRTLNTNFNGLVYLKYNSLPQDENGEIAIPIFTNGAIFDYLLAHIERKLIKNLILSNKASSEVKAMYPSIQQEETRLFFNAQAEAKMNGFSQGWEKKIYKQRLINRKRMGL